MKKIIKIFAVLFLLTILSCEKEEFEPLLKNKISTEFYGIFRLNVYPTNPLVEEKIKSTSKENIYWNDEYPIQVTSFGSGLSGQTIPIPYLGTGVTIREYDKNEPEFTSLKRSLRIEFPFSYHSFSTQELFYNLIQEDIYSFADQEEDFGKIIVQFRVNEKVYSSLGIDNSMFQVSIFDVEKVKPVFYNEPNGNNGNPASIKATLSFSCLLKNTEDEYILIEDAEIRGRFFRQSPSGNYWDDWGKGWDK